jgi:hypothetical protein
MRKRGQLLIKREAGRWWEQVGPRTESREGNGSELEAPNWRFSRLGDENYNPVAYIPVHTRVLGGNWQASGGYSSPPTPKHHLKPSVSDANFLLSMTSRFVPPPHTITPTGFLSLFFTHS